MRNINKFLREQFLLWRNLSSIIKYKYPYEYIYLQGPWFCKHPHRFVNAYFMYFVHKINILCSHSKNYFFSLCNFFQNDFVFISIIIRSYILVWSSGISSVQTNRMKHVSLRSFFVSLLSVFSNVMNEITRRWFKTLIRHMGNSIFIPFIHFTFFLLTKIPHLYHFYIKWFLILDFVIT